MGAQGSKMQTVLLNQLVLASTLCLSFAPSPPLIFDGPYVLVNKKNGNRIAAQKGFDDSIGFFVISNGPIYDDQRWKFDLQNDGSYCITNVFDGRRLLAHKDTGLGAAKFGL